MERWAGVRAAPFLCVKESKKTGARWLTSAPVFLDSFTHKTVRCAYSFHLNTSPYYTSYTTVQYVYQRWASKL